MDIETTRARIAELEGLIALHKGKNPTVEHLLTTELNALKVRFATLTGASGSSAS